LLLSQAFQENAIDIQFVDRSLGNLVSGDAPPSFYAVASVFARREVSAGADPWAGTDGWRLNLPSTETLGVRDRRDVEEAVVSRSADGTATLHWRGESATVDYRKLDRRRIAVSVDGVQRDLCTVAFGETVHVIGNDVVERVDLADPLGMPFGGEASAGSVVAPMPGKLSQVFVSAGQAVNKGDRLAIVEAMKMEHVLKAPFDATVSAVNAQAGSFVEEGVVLVALEAAA